MTGNGSGRHAVGPKTTANREKSMDSREVHDSRVPEQLTLHVGDEEQLFDRARRCSKPTELVVSPVELHQRNVQRRLREANLPKDAFVFEDPVGISKLVLEEAGHSTTTIDRIDRLTLLRSILESTGPKDSMETHLPSEAASCDPQTVEQIRTEVETVTNFHPKRVSAWSETAAELYDPIDKEAEEFLDAALTVERHLRNRTPKAISETELVRRATRLIVTSNGTTWKETYPEIERLILLGLSSLSAPHTDLVHSLTETTSVEVHIHFRSGAGEYLASRVRDLLSVPDPGQEVFE